MGVWATAVLGGAFPWGTVAVNLAGCAAIGGIAGGLAGGAALAPPLRLFLVTGVLGGFTTFSAFALDTGLLWARSPALAALNVAVSVAGGLGGYAAAFAAARRIAG